MHIRLQLLQVTQLRAHAFVLRLFLYLAIIGVITTENISSAAILCTLNAHVSVFNTKVQALLPGNLCMALFIILYSHLYV